MREEAEKQKRSIPGEQAQEGHANERFEGSGEYGQLR